MENEDEGRKSIRVLIDGGGEKRWMSYELEHIWEKICVCFNEDRMNIIDKEEQYTFSFQRGNNWVLRGAS